MVSRRWIKLAVASAIAVIVVGLSLNLLPGQVRASFRGNLNFEGAIAQVSEQHRGDRPIASPAIAEKPLQPVTGKNVQYGSIAGEPLVGYLAKPVDAEGPLPGLIVIQEWWGLNDNIEAITRRLAGEGYAALAVDLYDGQVAATPEEARPLMEAALANPDRLDSNLRQAYAYLDRDEGAPTIGSIGWCLGGSMSLRAALLLPDDLDAAVIYYGGQLETDPQVLAPLQMPIAGFFGGQDRRPSPETVAQFRQALATAGKEAEIEIYPDADHAFANPSGTRYNPAAAADAWQRTRDFLARTLKEES